MNRRRFLVSLSAATAAAGGAYAWRRDSKPFPPLPLGEILGASNAIGHRLRRMEFPEPTETLKTPVVIVGGGIAGLSAGWKLQKAGFTDFVILELEQEVGGNSRSGQNTISAYPWGAHYLPFPTQECRAVRELLADFGILQGDHMPQRRFTKNAISTLPRRSGYTRMGFGMTDCGRKSGSASRIWINITAFRI